MLKHFQAATAEPHAPTPDGGVMTGIVKPEIRNVLQIGWAVVRGILELAIMVYVLTSILDSQDTIIVAVLGIIYATIRGAALFQHLTITQMAWAGDRQSLEQRLEEDPNVDSEISTTDVTVPRILAGGEYQCTRSAGGPIEGRQTLAPGCRNYPNGGTTKSALEQRSI